jgi:hypothetical protein
MRVVELRCPGCDIVISGEFDGCPFCQLDKGAIEFLIAFLRCEGNISKLGQVLKVSYPKIKRELDQLMKDLGVTPVEGEEDVLDALEKGKISVETAVELLKKRRRR